MANPWFPFYVDDYERKTSHLTLLERGAYSELIRRYYMIGGPLPANALQVHRMCRADAGAEQDAIDYCLSEFFRLEDDGYHNARCDEEIAKSRAISEKRANSANSRHKKSDANAHANAMQLHTQLQPQLQPQKIEPPPNPLKEGEPKEAKSSKRKRRTRVEILAPYPDEVTELVNCLTQKWPGRQPGDGKPIEVDLSKLAERIDGLLRQDGITRELIEQSANRYLSELKRYYKHPQFFFGEPSGDSANWQTYARMIVHEQSKQVTQ